MTLMTLMGQLTPSPPALPSPLNCNSDVWLAMRMAGWLAAANCYGRHVFGRWYVVVEAVPVEQTWHNLSTDDLSTNTSITFPPHHQQFSQEAN